LSEQDQDGNRLFSFAMIAMENGDFAKAEKLFQESIELLGKTHHVSLLAMKTLSGLLSERGRPDDALAMSIDLLETQIDLFGVNHSETTRTVNSILEMCKDLGSDDTAREIADLVKNASEVEKVKTTQSFRKLRKTNSDVDDLKVPIQVRSSRGNATKMIFMLIIALISVIVLALAYPR
jgi:ATP/maltotriose-dependent transcriptional regulator MalT